jgi:hypothetical protein
MLEFQLTSDSSGAMATGLTILLGLSFGVCLVYLCQFLAPRFALDGKYDRFCKLLVAVLASLQIFALHLYYYRESHDTVALWCFFTAFGGGAIVWRLATGFTSVEPKLERVLAFALAAISIVEFAGFSHATKCFSETVEMLVAPDPGVLVSKSEVIACTDRGTPIDLAERQMTEEAFQAYVENIRRSLRGLSEKAMLRAQPMVESNCHGWVFAKGEHIVRGEEVQLILDENGYRGVFEPEANDVVLYRNDSGAILHTGLVRGFLEGAVIVESKWGIGALYMHIAEEQPYSQNISYWRTARGSHDLRIEATPPATAAIADSLAGM